MSAITAPRPGVSRPATITAAIVLLVLLGLSVLIPLPGTDDLPLAVLLPGYAFAALKVVAAIGLWWCKKWATILGFVVVLLDALLAAPGLFGAPTAALQLYLVIGVVLSIVALVLLALPASRRAYA